jgi:hypothetical protein
MGEPLNTPDLDVRPKRPRRRLLIVAIATALVIGGTVGGLAWFNADQLNQEQAHADEAQRKTDADAAAAAAAKKAASDAYWAKAHAQDQQHKADAAAKDAAAAASDIAAKGWKKAATDIYTGDIPGGYRCTRLACNQFLVMTTAQNGCPRGIVIRGRWLQNGVVTGPITEVTGPMRSGEQAAVEVLDYTGTADTADLTEFRCT